MDGWMDIFFNTNEAQRCCYGKGTQQVKVGVKIHKGYAKNSMGKLMKKAN